jgi:ribonuclease D
VLSKDRFMKTLTTTKELAAYCNEAASQPYVTIDTEFLRERTYYSKLCLIQMAMPGEDDTGAVLIDVLSGKMELDPLYDLFRNESVVKVFHAARQDLEIFFVEGKVFPKPFFDTQVAAMVCGFGEQVGYETLVRKIMRASVDKSSRFTDWSRRPLTEKQQTYALADVTHLRGVYEFLAARIKQTNRVKWVEEELEILTNPVTYTIHPEDAWKRLKTRTTSPKFLAVARELARFRENYAQTRNVPRSRVYKDDALLELASTKPQNIADLGRSRLLLREARKGDIADGILAAVDAGVNCPKDEWPTPRPQREKQAGSEGLADLLRVLLKAKAEEAGVAQKLIATVGDLDAIAAGEVDGPALHGWRFEVFGEDALKLTNGKVALSANGKSVILVDVPS